MPSEVWTTQVSTWTCSRCGAVVDAPDREKPLGWMTLEWRRTDDQSAEWDLCVKCARAFGYFTRGYQVHMQKAD